MKQVLLRVHGVVIIKITIFNCAFYIKDDLTDTAGVLVNKVLSMFHGLDD